MYQQLYKKNVLYVRDFFDHEGRPLDFHRFIHRFHIDRFPFPLYFGLIHSIPRSWKVTGSELNDSPNNDHLLTKLLQAPRVSQFIYNMQLKRNVIEPTAVKKMEGAICRY